MVVNRGERKNRRESRTRENPDGRGKERERILRERKEGDSPRIEFRARPSVSALSLSLSARWAPRDRELRMIPRNLWSVRTFVGASSGLLTCASRSKVSASGSDGGVVLAPPAPPPASSPSPTFVVSSASPRESSAAAAERDDPSASAAGPSLPSAPSEGGGSPSPPPPPGRGGG